VTSVEAPEDEAFLSARRWWKARCARCGHPDVATTEVGHIEQATGAGFGIRFCRACVVLVLNELRADAEEDGQPYEPRLPDMAEPISFPRLRRRHAG
jgi:hypothetical protein